MSATRICPHCNEAIDASAASCVHCAERAGYEPGLIPDIGDYRIIELIGRGGMGIVYRGRHRDEARAMEQGGDVCIKKMHTQLAQEDEFKDRFQREATLGLTLDHPGIVKALEQITDGDDLALVMEFVEGRSLARLIGRETGPIPWQRAWPMFEQLLAAVEYAHEHDVIHRDLKPDNVMLTAHDMIKVLDFGLAKGFGAGATRTGTGLGTAHYMAPEQHNDAKNVDRRADIYALGMTLYVMLAGRLPWRKGINIIDILLKKQKAEIPPPTRHYPGIPAAVVNVVMTALAHDKEERPKSVGALRKQLEDANAALPRGEDAPLEALETPIEDPIEALETPLEDPLGSLEKTPIEDQMEALETPNEDPIEQPAGEVEDRAVQVEPTTTREAAPTRHEPLPAAAVKATITEEAKVEVEDALKATIRGFRGTRWVLVAAVGLLLAVGVWLLVWERDADEESVDPDDAEEPATEAPAGLINWKDIPAGVHWFGKPGTSIEVHIRQFKMAAHETTVLQYRTCVKAGACAKPGFQGDKCNWPRAGNHQPINGVGWTQATKFCKWVGGRLPSESEWAYAASDMVPWQVYPWGDARPDCDMAVMRGCSSGTRSVCDMKAGSQKLGLCDMAGNVREYVADCWHKGLRGIPRDGRPWTKSNCRGHVSRGGSFVDDARGQRNSTRRWVGRRPAPRWALTGFRCARNATGGPKVEHEKPGVDHEDPHESDESEDGDEDDDD